MLVKIQDINNDYEELYINTDHVLMARKDNHDGSYSIVMEGGIRCDTDKDSYDGVVGLVTGENEDETTEVKSDEGYVTCACGNKIHFKKLKAHDMIALVCPNCRSRIVYLWD